MALPKRRRLEEELKPLKMKSKAERGRRERRRRKMRRVFMVEKQRT